MPLYQFWCDTCFEPYEIQMSLAEKDRYDRKNVKERRKAKCPKCANELNYLIAPPKIIKVN